MTAAELTCEVLDKRNIPFKDKEYWSCWEVCDKEEMGEILKDAKQPWIKKKKIPFFYFSFDSMHPYWGVIRTVAAGFWVVRGCVGS